WGRRAHSSAGTRRTPGTRGRCLSIAPGRRPPPRAPRPDARKARADPRADPGRRERVHYVVEIVPVARPLGPAHPRERPVERVAEPVHEEQRARGPEPGGAQPR